MTILHQQHQAALVNKALSYLSRREHHRAELKSKLSAGKTNNEAIVEAVLDRLEAEGLLSDMRYIESFITSRVNKLYGPMRIRMELLQKKLNPESVEQILAEADTDWQHNAQTCLQKKFPQKPGNASELAKQRQFLWRRGYSEEMIRSALSSSDNE